jgi:hypothetical protein
MTKNETEATFPGRKSENPAETAGGATRPDPASRLGVREMLCPVCGTPMPDLKGGKAAICSVCGFKDSCCF